METSRWTLAGERIDPKLEAETKAADINDKVDFGAELFTSFLQGTASASKVTKEQQAMIKAWGGVVEGLLDQLAIVPDAKVVQQTVTGNSAAPVTSQDLTRMGNDLQDLLQICVIGEIL